MEERFLCIKVITDQNVADRACTALEQAGIAVILEHLDVGDGNVRASGFRLLTPSSQVQEALKVVELQSKTERPSRQHAA